MKKLTLCIGLLALCHGAFAQETLQTVTDRGSVTTNSLSIGGGSVNANTTKLFIKNPFGKQFALSSGANMISEEGFHIYNWTDHADFPFFSISNTGNVGVGSFTPKAKLDVKGDIMISNSVLPMGLITELAETESPLLNLSVNFRESNKNHSFGGAAFRIDTRTVNNSPLFQWLSRNAGTENERIMMTLNAEGNLGIGTLSPKERLSVNGNIRARQIKVEEGNWPDYVFEDNYALGSLEELARHIQMHKKLPDLPSAKEVEKEGLDLGLINKLLVKKIEELTLHLINKNIELGDQKIKQNIQELKIEKQEMRISKLEKAIDALLKNK